MFDTVSKSKSSILPDVACSGSYSKLDQSRPLFGLQSRLAPEDRVESPRVPGRQSFPRPRGAASGNFARAWGRERGGRLGNYTIASWGHLVD
jgi:hypothetical protein